MDLRTGYQRTISFSLRWTQQTVLPPFRKNVPQSKANHNRIQVALGFNLSDLVTGSTFVLQDSLGNDYRETPAPHGWYIGSGPSIFIDFLINPFLLLEVQYDYTFHFTNPVALTYGIDSPNQNMPHQSYLSVNLMTSFGLYAGVDYSLMLDQNPAPFNHRKIDWLMGFKFML